jgi:hypothetical protein
MVLLAGCAPASQPPGEPSPTATVAAPTPTPTVEAVVAPTPAIDLDCLGLEDTGVKELFASNDVSTQPSGFTIALAGGKIPYTFAIRQLGGLSCEWSNGAPYSSHLGGNPDYVGIRINAAPRPVEAWNLSPYASEAGSFPCNSSWCSGSGFVSDSWWVEVEAIGVKKSAAFAPTFDEILNRIASAPKTESGSTAPRSAQTPWPKCDELLSATDLTNAVDGNEKVVASTPEGPWSLSAESLHAVQAAWCTYYPENYESESVEGGILTTLPEGEWAALESANFNLGGGTRVPLSIDGLEDGEFAVARCDGGVICEIDIVVGNDWIKWGSSDRSISTNKLSAIAEIIIANASRL